MNAAVIQRNLANVQADIEAACAACGRDPSSVRLVAVTKYAEWEWVQSLKTAHTVFGENRPQQLAERQTKSPDAEWHLIGQLQRNKARLAVQHAAWIHSVDSARLLKRVAETAEELRLRPRVLLQVNVSGEQSKSGFSPDELSIGWNDFVSYHKHVELAGLMTMAPASPEPEDARSTFRGLAQLRDKLTTTSAAKAAEVSLTELSMGMSGDFVVAIEEGATLVRVGSRLFEGL